MAEHWVVADGHAVWGSGHTRQAALDDCIEWLDDDAPPITDYTHKTDVSGELRVGPCTEHLFLQVQRYGGALSFDWNEELGKFDTDPDSETLPY
jgi:hypothetical protein